MSVHITDTHPLIWFTLNKHSSLSKKALAGFESTIKGESFIYSDNRFMGSGNFRTKTANQIIQRFFELV